ncbi:hypothetical protein LZS94_18190 [Aliivibrio fischeri]|uniref:hypothetical protein n=1 Tax=Aliivibrio fischeri TaxID=668 RepID=UPI001F48A77E|nr:hypothetical protein [Aliivibrio fischeri]MCE7579449.1 hypothetical protein [Aliivibrio fischeri]MCE7591719.1 hypothetical protein [Aliivibrio fischeri]
MSKGVKVGDIGTAHDGFHETPILSGSPDVKFDGQPAASISGVMDYALMDCLPFLASK